MRSRRATYLILLFLMMGALVPVGAGARALAQPLMTSEGYDRILNQLSSGESQIEEARESLMKLSIAEMNAFVGQAQLRLDSKSEKREAALFAYEVLSRRPEFSKTMAAAVLPNLKPLVGDNSIRSESRLAIFLTARAGLLTDTRIQEELKLVSTSSQKSADRLARLGALIDAMGDAGRRPSTAQLETLLKSDVFEVRMLAVDWFRIQPPEGSIDRKRFLQAAVKANPVQVRERAYRTIASWPSQDVKAIAADVVSKSCEKETSSIIRSACVEIRTKAGNP